MKIHALRNFKTFQCCTSGSLHVLHDSNLSIVRFLIFSDAWADRLNVIPNNTESVALGAITVRIIILLLIIENDFF